MHDISDLGQFPLLHEALSALHARSLPLGVALPQDLAHAHARERRSAHTGGKTRTKRNRDCQQNVAVVEVDSVIKKYLGRIVGERVHIITAPT